jgi:hypothetical protein
MMRVALLALALTACAPQHAETIALQDCSEVDFSVGALEPVSCSFEAGGERFNVRYAELAEGVQAGTINVEVLGEDGAVLQTLLEPEVAEYRQVGAEDVDGDGRIDLLIPRMSGNVNTEYGVWIYNGERAQYARVGDVSGVQFVRTSEGLIAVPARSGAASWNVAFYKLDEGGLHLMATIRVDGEELTGGSIRSTCALEEAPGLGDLNLTQAAAETKFCAEPAAQVFAP